jgi:hypothetical protein
LNISIKNRIIVVECAGCGHRWVELAGERDRCLMCKSTEFKKPFVIGQLQEAYRKLSPDDKDYSDRLLILQKLYFDNIPIVLDRAKETFDKALKFYEAGEYSDRVLNRLIFCFFAFKELGLKESAFSCGNLIGAGYLQRNENLEVKSEEDLADLGRALQWFGLVDEPEWLATVNTRIAMKATHAVTENIKGYRRLLQIARKHLDLARSYYSQHNFPKLLEHIDSEHENVIRLLSGAVVGSGYVEGAEIQAQAIREMGQEISTAIRWTGKYLGLSLVEAGNQIREGIQAHGEAMSQAITDHGAKLEHGLEEVAGTLGVGFAGLSQSVRLGLGDVSRSVVRLGDKAEESLAKLGSEVRGGLVQASDNIRKEMGSLGNKVALGMIGGGAIGGLLTGGAINQLGASVTGSLNSASNTLAQATRWSGAVQADATNISGETQADPRNILIREGFDFARRMLPDIE